VRSLRAPRHCERPPVAEFYENLRSVVRNDPSNWLLQASRVKQKGAVYTETDWEVYPQGLTDTLVWVKERYGNPPVYITENGAAFADPPKVRGATLDDPKRVAYYHSHLRAVHAAREKGCDIRGYFAWSVLDNLEWSLGFSKRFGIVHVDFATQKRTPKASARFYSQVIASGGTLLDTPIEGPKKRAKAAKPRTKARSTPRKPGRSRRG